MSCLYLCTSSFAIVHNQWVFFVMVGATLHSCSLREIILEMSYTAWVTNIWLLNDLKHVQYFASNIIASRLSYIDQPWKCVKWVMKRNYAVDTHRFNVYKTSIRRRWRWNDVVCLLGTSIFRGLFRTMSSF